MTTEKTPRRRKPKQAYFSKSISTDGYMDITVLHALCEEFMQYTNVTVTHQEGDGWGDYGCSGGSIQFAAFRDETKEDRQKRLAEAKARRERDKFLMEERQKAEVQALRELAARHPDIATLKDAKE